MEILDKKIKNALVNKTVSETTKLNVGKMI